MTNSHAHAFLSFHHGSKHIRERKCFGFKEKNSKHQYSIQDTVFGCQKFMAKLTLLKCPMSINFGDAPNKRLNSIPPQTFKKFLLNP